MRKEILMDWPSDDDGDVFRSLRESGFDFDKEYKIDINLDFNHWPLLANEKKAIDTLFPEAEYIEPEAGEDIGNGANIGFINTK